MTSVVSSDRTGTESKSSTERKVAAADPSQAFDAALAAQWMLQAQMSRGSVATPPASVRGGASACESIGRCDSQDKTTVGSNSSSKDEVNAASHAAKVQGLTQLSTQEMEGHLPSRKEMARSAAEEHETQSATQGEHSERTREGSKSAEKGTATAASGPGGRFVLPSVPDGSVGSRGAATMGMTSARRSAEAIAPPAGKSSGAVTAQKSPNVAVSGAAASGARGAVQPALGGRAATAVRAIVGAVSGTGARAVASAGRAGKVATAPAPRKPEMEHPVSAHALRGLVAALRQGSGSTTLRITPEHLGQLRISVDVKATEVVARVQATSDEAAKALKENTPQLREALEAQGFAVSRIEVEHVSPALMQARGHLGGERSMDGGGGQMSHEAGGNASNTRNGSHNDVEHGTTGTAIAESARGETLTVSAFGVNAIA